MKSERASQNSGEPGGVSPRILRREESRGLCRRARQGTHIVDHSLQVAQLQNAPASAFRYWSQQKCTRWRVGLVSAALRASRFQHQLGITRPYNESVKERHSSFPLGSLHHLCRNIGGPLEVWPHRHGVPGSGAVVSRNVSPFSRRP